MAKISKKRKATYYIGLGIIVLGFILFLSLFIQFAVAVKESVANPFMDPFDREPPSFLNAVIGFILIIVGGFITNVGAKGAAGSGLKLDPEEAVEDLKPFNEAKGKMINDIISNIDAIDNIANAQAPKEIIKIRCKACNCLNDEDAKFCKNCGAPI